MDDRTPTTADLETTTDQPGSTPLQAVRHQPRPRRDERGEGVISTAIAVLVVAFLGIGLWTGFDSMMNSATERTRTQVEQIGE
ncbi:hypothetical protein BH10ACT3_BH10ACT3_07620 [soil metagenome]